MNAIHQISLKLRLGIDTQANIQPEVLLKKWQDMNDTKLCNSHLRPPPQTSHTREMRDSGSPVRRK